jgi:hypothetical protein
VVEVLVRDEHELGLDVFDRRIVEPQAARRERLARDAERVDEHGVLGAQQEGGLAEPASEWHG